ncbi:MAG: hypothetical protein RL166_799 [Actinomycetota bacterium]|jgi:hypothetical protein
MKSFGLKALTAISVVAVFSGALTGCSPAKPAKPATLASIGCNDETLKNWDHFSYTIGSWKHGSSRVSGFGLFSCDKDATIKFSVTPNGTNLVNAGTFLALGNDQLAIGSLLTLDQKFINFKTAIPTTTKSIRVPAGQKFQPLAQLDQSKYGLTYGKEPVTLTMTIKVKGKPSITLKKTLALATDKSANPKPLIVNSGPKGA